MNNLNDLVTIISELETKVDYYETAEFDEDLQLEPVGVKGNEFIVKIKGGEYGYKPNPALFKGDLKELEKEFLAKIEDKSKALEWLKKVTILTSRPGGQKVAQAPGDAAKLVNSVKVKSEKDPSKEYTVSNFDDGKWVCDCPHFIHRSAECKHIKQVKSGKVESSESEVDEKTSPSTFKKYQALDKAKVWNEQDIQNFKHQINDISHSHYTKKEPEFVEIFKKIMDEFEDGKAVDITPEQSEKGILWLRNNILNKEGKLRDTGLVRDAGFGEEEANIIKNFKEFKLIGFSSNSHGWFSPVYKTIAKNKDSFNYKVTGGYGGVHIELGAVPEGLYIPEPPKPEVTFHPAPPESVTEHGGGGGAGGGGAPGGGHGGGSPGGGAHGGGPGMGTHGGHGGGNWGGHPGGGHAHALPAASKGKGGKSRRELLGGVGGLWGYGPLWWSTPGKCPPGYTRDKKTGQCVIFVESKAKELSSLLDSLTEADSSVNVVKSPKK